MENTFNNEDFIKSLQSKEAMINEQIKIKYIELEALENQLEAIENAIDVFKNTIKRPTIREPAKKIPIPTHYSNDLTWSEKVLWATQTIGGGFVDDIAQTIHNAEPEKDLEKIKGAVTQYASYLKGNGNLRYEQHGQRYKYMI